MRKFIIGISLVLALGLIGCGRNAQQTPNTNNTKVEKGNDIEEGTNVEEETDVESEFKFPEGQSQVGEGTIYVSTPAGTSEDNNVPAVMVDKDAAVTQIGLNAENFNASKVSYVYINKKFVEKMQLGEMSQTALNLEGDFLNPGTYTVSVVQFDNNDSITGKVTQFAEAKFEVKSLQ